MQEPAEIFHTPHYQCFSECLHNYQLFLSVSFNRFSGTPYGILHLIWLSHLLITINQLPLSFLCLSRLVIHCLRGSLMLSLFTCLIHSLTSNTPHSSIPFSLCATLYIHIVFWFDHPWLISPSEQHKVSHHSLIDNILQISFKCLTNIFSHSGMPQSQWILKPVQGIRLVQVNIRSASEVCGCMWDRQWQLAARTRS